MCGTTGTMVLANFFQSNWPHQPSKYHTFIEKTFEKQHSKPINQTSILFQFKPHSSMYTYLHRGKLWLYHRVKRSYFHCYHTVRYWIIGPFILILIHSIENTSIRPKHILTNWNTSTANVVNSTTFQNRFHNIEWRNMNNSNILK